MAASGRNAYATQGPETWVVTVQPAANEPSYRTRYGSGSKQLISTLN